MEQTASVLRHACRQTGPLRRVAARAPWVGRTGGRGRFMGRGHRDIKARLVICLAALLACVLVFLAACANGGDGVTYTTFAEIEDKRIGVTTGSIQADQATKRFPDAKIFQYNTTTDMLNALKSHKIDAFAEASAIAQIILQSEPELVCLEEHLSETSDIAGIFPMTDEGRTLRDEYSDYIREIKASGEYDKIIDVWLGSDTSLQVAPDLGDLKATKGTHHVALDTSMYPFVYLKDGRIGGLDPAIAYGFAKSHGYALKPLVMDFGSILPAITTGKADFAAGGFVYTEERAESVLFSEPTYQGYSVICVLGAPVEGKGIVESVTESFEKTFIREGRWKLFVSGVGTTLVITLCSCVLGALLGFCLYLLWRRGTPWVVGLCNVVLKLVHGMPTVVLLMVLYYVVFGSIDLSGLIVAIVGFSLVFAVAAFGMLDSGVRAVDAGQLEAASALGYTDNAAFFKLILPQAALHFMPDLTGSVISLLKGTSVVGYIAVQDLTKMGDIVRSATYDAFFPLIAVTILYFAIEWVLGRVIALIAARMDPRRRTPDEILKGLTT